MESVVQLITVLIIFGFVLALTYFTTVWIGNYQKTRFTGTNIELLEAQRLNQNQYIQVVRICDRHLILGVSKDNITLLGELSPEEMQESYVSLQNTAAAGMPDFKAVLKQVGDRFSKK
ncbi:MAG: flagellar biosynthetic protein FliO [Lachnospiraceae bacterium]|nr:flagellar biosynthetic protein FliO [Lachnospiraceae bacterium]